MTILAAARRSVNRTFGQGILDAKTTADARLAANLIDSEPTRWAASVKLLMIGLGYNCEAANLAIRWLSCPRGKVDRCPGIDPADYAAINATKAEAGRVIVTAAERAALVAEADAELPPAVVVRDLPGDDDRQWWAANSPANRRGFRVVGFAPMVTRGTVRCEHADRALGGMMAGIIPVELAEAVMSRSLVGHNW